MPAFFLSPGDRSRSQPVRFSSSITDTALSYLVIATASSPDGDHNRQRCPTTLDNDDPARWATSRFALPTLTYCWNNRFFLADSAGSGRVVDTTSVGTVVSISELDPLANL